MVEYATPISTFEGLDKVRRNLGGNYKLACDIHCPQGHNWEPIGDYKNPFAGTFNGQGFTVYDLRAEWPERDYVGMFGVVKRREGFIAGIGNLKLNEVSVCGKSYIGSLIGFNVGGFLMYCDAIGEVNGIFGVGGDVGNNLYGVLYKCISRGKVDGNKHIGGVIGINSQGYVLKCTPNDFVKKDSVNYKGSLIGSNFFEPDSRDDYSECIDSPGTIGLSTDPNRR